MKKTLTIFGFLLTTSALFSQSINANFETDNEGWTSHQSTVEWTNLFAPMNDRGGIHFSGERIDSINLFVEGQNIIVDALTYRNLFLIVQKEVQNLLPNRNYRVTFNMNWHARLKPSVSPIFVKVGAMNQPPTEVEIEMWSGVKRMLMEEVLEYGEPEREPRYEIWGTGGSTEYIIAKFEKGELGQDGRDFVVAGQLTPNENHYAFMQNVNNFDNPFYVSTDQQGRLFLMIGIETENEKIENVYLNTLRVLLQEISKTQKVSEYTEIGFCEKDELLESLIGIVQN